MCISAPLSSACPDRGMADNSTHPILEILQSFSTQDVILAFCLSMVVGLILGGLVYAGLTWASRRRATATITRSSSYPRVRPVFDRRSISVSGGPALSFHRRTSASPDLLGRKDSFRASTFHPLLQCSQIAREAEEGVRPNLSRNSVSGGVVTPPRPRPTPDSFWGSNNPQEPGTAQTPPPPYNSIIRAYQETCT